jgi:hypothetical protein
MPDDRSQVVKADLACSHLYIGVQWCNPVPTLILSTRNANIAYNTANPPTWHEHTCTFTPDLVELVQELFIIFNVSELPWMLVVLF